MVPPCVPFFLPAAESVPEILTIWAVAPADRVRRDHAASVDDGIDHGARRRGGELDPSAVGSDLALVAHQRLERPAGRDVDHLRGDLVADGERDQLVAVEVEREAVARHQRHGAERRRDGAGVAHAGRDQRGKAAARGGDPPLIDDRGIGPARDVEIIPAGHEVRVSDVVGGGEEARRVHHGVGAEQDAVAIDDEHAAVRRQRAEDLRRPEPAGHAVEHDRRGAGLIEAHALVDADIERIPVDNRAAARLVDDHRRTALALDRGGAADDGAAEGSARSRRRAQRDERRSREHEIAQAWMHRNATEAHLG